jgi:hypothetical protein
MSVMGELLTDSGEQVGDGHEVVVGADRSGDRAPRLVLGQGGSGGDGCTDSVDGAVE